MYIKKRCVAPSMMRLGLALVFTAGGCDLFFPPPTGNGQNGLFNIETIVGNANSPVDLAFTPDGRAFYTEKNTGQVRVIKGGALLPLPFTAVPVNGFSERGLLGIALHPDFATNGLVYIFYTRSATGQNSADFGGALEQRVVRFRAQGDVAITGEEVIVTLPVGVPGNHNGGIIRFGPDGMLYVGFGDLGDTSNSQDLAVRPGKILRYNPDGAVPNDNPFGADNPAFAVGLRNPFGMDFDTDGHLFVNENGPGNHDEVNRIEAGANYGWPAVHGRADDGPGDPGGEVQFAADNANYRDPLFDKTDGSVGAAGLVVNTSDALGDEFVGDLFFGQFRDRRLMRLVRDAFGTTAVAVEVFIDDLPGSINGMALAPDGSLWVTTTNSILRITRAAP